jgi:hypothetical protein
MACRDYAAQFLLPTRWSINSPTKAKGGRDWVIQSMYNFAFKDEFDYVYANIKQWMGEASWAEFVAASGDIFTPRHDDVFEEELATRLAIRPDGTYIPGKIGTTQIGESIIGQRPKLVTLRKGTPREHQTIIMKNIRKPHFAGDLDYMGSMGALNFNMSAEAALLALDAFVDVLDNEAGQPVMKGYTGAQPADPDAATTGTLLFTCSTTAGAAFAAAVDDADGTVSATASAITDDSSADATGTLSYLRASSSADGATETDPQIDGSCGTSAADWIFNTLAIVTGANVSLDSWRIDLDQGASAT